MSTLTIPLNSLVNTKDDIIITNIQTDEKDILQKKNSLMFKSCLSPLYKKTESKVYTTAGHRISKIDNSTLEDERGRRFSIDNSMVISKSVDITNLWSGELTSAVCKNNRIYSVWKSERDYSIITSDMENNILDKKTVEVPNDILYYNVKLSNYTRAASKADGKIFYAVQLVRSDRSTISLYNLEEEIWNQEFPYLTGKDLYVLTYRRNNQNKTIIGTDDVDVRKRMSFQDGARIYQFFGCLGSNGLLTGEPILHNISSSSGKVSEAVVTTTPNINYLSNGQSYTPTFDDSYSDADATWDTANSSLSLNKITDNTATTWGNVTHTRVVQKAFIGGYDLEQGIPLIISASLSRTADEFPNPGTIKSGDIFPVSEAYYSLPGDKTKGDNKNQIGFEQIDFSYGLGSVVWSEATTAKIQNGCNPFPYRYTISNRADAKNVYYSYGPGFVRSYVRECIVGQISNTTVRRVCYERFPTAIVSYGLNPAEYKVNTVRIEPLTPTHYGTDVPSITDNDAGKKTLQGLCQDGIWHKNTVYKRLHLCDNSQHNWVDFLGVDNLGSKTILNRIPFQVSVCPELNILDQYYNGVYMSTGIEGTLLISASMTLNSNSTLFIENDVKASMFSNGMIIVGEKNGNVTLNKVADYIYRTNTIKGNNLFLDGDNLSGSRGFFSYNGEELIDVGQLSAFYSPTDTSTSEANDNYYTAAGFNQEMNDMSKRACSYLLPAASIPVSIASSLQSDFDYQLSDNRKPITRPLLINNFTYKDEAVDHYYTHSNKSTNVLYQTSNKLESSTNDREVLRYGIQTFDVDKMDFVWDMSGTVLFYPLGLASEVIGINYISSTVNMTDNYTVRLYQKEAGTFVVYNPTTEVYQGSTIFTMYGYNYSFDGQSIYYLGAGSDTSQFTFSCYALGMKFLANSGEEAYFYSTFEKKLYLFTGSVTLQMSDSLAREGNIIDSIYSSAEQILYLLTDEGKLICRSQDDMAIIEDIPTGYHLESTETGLILSNGFNYIKFRLYKTEDDEEVLPLEIETEFLGNNNGLLKLNLIDVTLKKTKNKVTGSVYMDVVYDKEPKRYIQNFSASDWTAGLQKIQFTVPNNVGKAIRIGLMSNDEISVSDFSLNIEMVSENTNTVNKR